MRIRVYRSAQPLYYVANALYWKSSKRQIFTHLAVLKHQNTKTSLYELSKNHWVFALFEIFGPIRKRLQSTVFNDHPVPFFEAFVHPEKSLTHSCAPPSPRLSSCKRSSLVKMCSAVYDFFGIWMIINWGKLLGSRL